MQHVKIHCHLRGWHRLYWINSTHCHPTFYILLAWRDVRNSYHSKETFFSFKVIWKWSIHMLFWNINWFGQWWNKLIQIALWIFRSHHCPSFLFFMLGNQWTMLPKVKKRIQTSVTLCFIHMALRKFKCDRNRIK